MSTLEGLTVTVITGALIVLAITLVHHFRFSERECRKTKQATKGEWIR